VQGHGVTHKQDGLYPFLHGKQHYGAACVGKFLGIQI
jgi:hypothetical protein